MRKLKISKQQAQLVADAMRQLENATQRFRELTTMVVSSHGIDLCNVLGVTIDPPEMTVAVPKGE